MHNQPTFNLRKTTNSGFLPLRLLTLFAVSFRVQRSWRQPRRVLPLNVLPARSCHQSFICSGTLHWPQNFHQTAIWASIHILAMCQDVV